MGVDGPRSFTRDGRAHHVADGQRARTFGLRFAQGGDSVRCFAALGDEQREFVLAHDGVAITPFAGVIHLDWETGKMLDHELSGESGVPTCSASGDADLGSVLEFFGRDTEFFEEYL